jgi:hypothetical protein
MINSTQRINKRYKALIFILISIFAIVYWVLFDFIRQVDFDSPSFYGASRLMFHLDGGYNFQSRLSKPLVLILPGLFEYLTGLHPKYTFLVQNIICYYASAFLIYKMLVLILDNEKHAFLGVMAYIMSQPFAVFSLFYLVDMVGWFFGIFAIYLLIKNTENNTLTQKKVMLISFITGLGLLTKESAIIGVIFMVIHLLLSKKSWIKKSSFILLSMLFTAIPFLISNLLTQKYYGVSVFSRVMEQQQSQGWVFYNSGNFQQLFRILDVYWFLFALGFWSFMKSYKQLKYNIYGLAFLITAFVALLTMPIYPFVVDRILFMVAPVLLLFIVLGSSFFGKHAFKVIFIGGILNVAMSWLIYKYNLGGVLMIGYLLYPLILLILYLHNNQYKFRNI